MNDVRLCIASPSFYPVVGGSHTRFTRYLPGFAERGVGVEIFTGTPKPKKVPSQAQLADWVDEAPGTMIPTPSISGVPVHRRRTHDKGRLRMRDLGSGLRAYCRNSPHRPNVMQWISALRPGIKPWHYLLRHEGVGIVHALTIAPRQEEKLLRKLSKVQRLKFVYRPIDCVVANAEAGRDLLRDMGIRARIEVIPNGVDLERFRPAEGLAERQHLRKALDIDPDRRVLVAVGTISPRKGSDLLIESWRRLIAEHDDLDLIFVGTRKDQMHDDLDGFKQCIADLLSIPGAEDRIRFTGYVPNVEEYLRAADACVLASDREGLPNSVLEAMASRLPVVVTRFHGLSSEIGQQGREYALCDRDVDSLTRTLDEILSEPARADELADAGHRFVQMHMALDRSIDSYVQIYRETANRVR